METGTETPAVPETSFTCSDKPYIPGLYADIEAKCQQFTYCYGDESKSFVCPPLTLFDQKTLVCNHQDLVDCAASPKYYDSNQGIGEADSAKPVAGNQGSDNNSVDQESSVAPSTDAPEEPTPATIAVPAPAPVKGGQGQQQQQVQIRFAGVPVANPNSVFAARRTSYSSVVSNAVANATPLVNKPKPQPKASRFSPVNPSSGSAINVNNVFANRQGFAGRYQ